MTDVAGELRGLAVALEAIPHRSMITAAKASKQIVADEGARIAGPDGMGGGRRGLNGKPRRGLRMKARDTIKDNAEGGTTCRVQGTIPAWIWANTGTKPHAIRRRKRGPLAKMMISHPGTRARGAWERTAARIEDVVPRIFSQTVDEVLGRA